MPRLKRVSVSGPGLTRRREGDAWAYFDAAGARVTDPGVIARIDALVLPPAWEDVWICPIPHGHIQATGLDARGRRQYRYHDHWRVLRDLAKHERILDFAEALPAARQRIIDELQDRDFTRRRVLACAVRLLDLGFFRVGSEQYAEENHTYGLATIRREHVRVARNGVITFDYIAKSGKHRVQAIADPDVVRVVTGMKRRRSGDEELLAWREGGRWVDVKSHDINDYLREVTGGDYTAKDFRTWSATVMAAVGLAVSTHADTPTARKRAVTRVVKEVAEKLGNTPAVCRASYIDPRIVDLYDHGVTIAPQLEELGDEASYGSPAFQGAIEQAVLSLLREPEAQQLAG